jgi:hypothetical protein
LRPTNWPTCAESAFPAQQSRRARIGRNGRRTALCQDIYQLRVRVVFNIGFMHHLDTLIITPEVLSLIARIDEFKGAN